MSESACPSCRGTGFVVTVHEDGRSAARRCACRTDLNRKLRLEAARIPPRYQHCTLGSFEHYPKITESLRVAHRQAFRVVQEFSAHADDLRRGLLLAGPCGVGKTHLAAGILREVLENYPVWGLFAEFTDLLRRIQDTYDKRSETSSLSVLQPALEADVLVLDDLGCTRMTPWVTDTLGLIINERYNANLLTLFTTNRRISAPKGEETLADRIGARLASRLQEMCFILELDGPDYRSESRSAHYHR